MTAAALRACAAGYYPAEGGTSVSLRDAIPGLDTCNLRLFITAIQHAAGQRPPHP